MRYLKIAWISVCILLLVVTIYLFDGSSNSDVDTLLIWAMLALTFPIGFGCALLFSGITHVLYSCFSITLTNTYLTLLLIWVVYFGAGYIQWFKIIPYLTKKWGRGKT